MGKKTLESILDYTGHRWIPIQCPFHKDSDASAGYLPASQAFNCLGCGKKIKGKNRILEALGKESDMTSNNLNSSLSIGEIEDTLEDIYGLALDVIEEYDETHTPRTAHTTIDTLLSNDEDTDREEDHNLAPIFPWLRERNISMDTVLYWRGVYFPKDKHIGKYNVKNHIAFTFNRERSIVFRNMGDGQRYHLAGKRVLFNQSCIDNFEQIFMVEGITDFLAMWEMGFRNTVCAFGAEPDKKLLYPLKGKTVFLLYDTDFAGYEGMEKAATMLRELKARPISLTIPKSFDYGDDKIDVGGAWQHKGTAFLAWVKGRMESLSAYDQSRVNRFLSGSMESVQYVRTGITTFDNNVMRGGLATGLHVFGGEPESGKSTLVTQLKDEFIGQSKRVLCCTYELPVTQMYARLASRRTKKLSWQDIERSPLRLQLEEPDAAKAFAQLSNYFKIEAGWSIEMIEAAIHNFDVVFVDYIQRMPFPGKDTSPRDGIIANINRLGTLATEHNKIIVAISSIPRSAYSGDPSTYARSIFKESGNIEFVAQSAHAIVRIPGQSGVSAIRTVKNTRGETNLTTHIRVVGNHQRIEAEEFTEIFK